jgi:NAD(P)-dependent dehydrogenase (short-subunit alcohol dehydrogenase family)
MDDDETLNSSAYRSSATFIHRTSTRPNPTLSLLVCGLKRALEHCSHESNGLKSSRVVGKHEPHSVPHIANDADTRRGSSEHAKNQINRSDIAAKLQHGRHVLVQQSWLECAALHALENDTHRIARREKPRQIVLAKNGAREVREATDALLVESALLHTAEEELQPRAQNPFAKLGPLFFVARRRLEIVAVLASEPNARNKGSSQHHHSQLGGKASSQHRQSGDDAAAMRRREEKMRARRPQEPRVAVGQVRRNGRNETRRQHGGEPGATLGRPTQQGRQRGERTGSLHQPRERKLLLLGSKREHARNLRPGQASSNISARVSSGVSYEKGSSPREAAQERQEKQKRLNALALCRLPQDCPRQTRRASSPREKAAPSKRAKKRQMAPIVGTFSLAFQEVKALLAVLSVIVIFVLLLRRTRRSFAFAALVAGLAGCRQYASFPRLPDGLRCQGVALVTGVTRGGIGYETALLLGQRGCYVVLAGRNTTAAAADLRTVLRDRTVTAMTVDLTSFASVRAFAAAFSERFKSLDLVVLNAGMMGVNNNTADGLEPTGQVNHLSQFLLTKLLLPRLQAAKKPRVVVVASGAAVAPGTGPQNWREIWTTPCTGATFFLRYGQSKLANVLFARGETSDVMCNACLIFCFFLALTDRYPWLEAVSVHPGFMVTALYRQLLPAWIDFLLEHVSSVMAKTVPAGAHVSVIAALQHSPCVARGCFIGSDGYIFDYPEAVNVTSDGATLLWDASEAILK